MRTSTHDDEGEHDHGDEEDHADEGEHDHGDEEDHADEDEHDHGDEEDHADEGEHDHGDEEDHADEGEHDHGDEEDHADEGEHDHGDEEDHADEDEHDHGDEDDHAHEHDGDDPHFWLDPARMSQTVVALADRIAELDDTLSDEEWTERGAALAADLDDLSTEMEEILADVPDDRRLLVTNHDAFGYFADAFDFEIVGSIIPGGSTLAEASAQDIEELVDRIEETGAPAVFVDATDSSRLADVVAEQAEGAVAVGMVNTGSLGEPDGPAGTYRDYMIDNATTIADLLGSGG